MMGPEPRDAPRSVPQLRYRQDDVRLLGVAVGHSVVQFLPQELDHFQCGALIVRVNWRLQHMRNTQ